MYKVIEILNQVYSTGSRNEKEAIFKENKDNELLQKVLEYTYNPYKVYGIKERTLDLNATPRPSKTGTIFDILDYISTVNINDEIRSQVSSFICAAESKELKDLYVKMILKDLRLGATTKTINKIWKGLIPEFNVMLAHAYKDRADKIKGESIIITTKLDGIRILARKEGSDVKLYTRQGKLLEDCIDIEEELSKLPDGCYDGELLKINTDNLNSKELFQETKKITGKKGIKKDLEFHVFDYLSVEEFKQGKSKSGCWYRKNKVTEILESFALQFIKEVKILCITTDHSHIKEYLDKAITNGQEGIMVNLSDGKYECKRSNNILKVKEFYTFDGKILDIYEGTGKYQGKLGGIVVTYKDIKVNVGSGFTDHEREMYYNNPETIIGKIGECSYFEETIDQHGKQDLRFCTWKGLRDDKGVDDINYE